MQKKIMVQWSVVYKEPLSTVYFEPLLLSPMQAFSNLEVYVLFNSKELTYVNSLEQ